MTKEQKIKALVDYAFKDLNCVACDVLDACAYAYGKAETQKVFNERVKKLKESGKEFRYMEVRKLDAELKEALKKESAEQQAFLNTIMQEMEPSICALFKELGNLQKQRYEGKENNHPYFPFHDGKETDAELKIWTEIEDKEAKLDDFVEKYAEFVKQMPLMHFWILFNDYGHQSHTNPFDFWVLPWDERSSYDHLNEVVESRFYECLKYFAGEETE